MTKLNTAERARLLAVGKKYGTPLYVYDASVILAQCAKLRRHFPDTVFHYAMKANSNPAILLIIKKAGFGVEAVSLGELALARKCGFKSVHISFTCSNLTEAELKEASVAGVRVHLDSLGQLETWGRLKLGPEASIRLNQGIGAGHHAHVITGGPDSKFGISLRDIPKARALAEKYKISITGIQQHIGSNVLDAELFEKAIRTLLATATLFPDIARVDFGGGIGVPYTPGSAQMPLAVLGKRVRTLTRTLEQGVGRDLSFPWSPVGSW